MARERLREVRNINYLAKDFDAIKQDLINYLQENFPNDFQDFNEASGGMALVELLAYVGDQMNFYTDRQANETFINRAVEEKNIIALSKTLGRKPKFATPAITTMSLSAVFDTSTSSDQYFKINKGSRFATNIGTPVTFETLDDVDFSLTANRSLVNDGTFTTASISGVNAVAGFSRTFVYTVGNAQDFLKVTLPDDNITEIVSVSSSDGNEWFEVDYLAQDTVFVGELNDTSSSASIPYVLKVKRVPRRYTKEVEPNNTTSIRFGNGKFDLEDSEIVPNPDDYVLPITLRGSASSFSPSTINSGQFLNTKTLGVAPRNVSLDIKYRYGGGINTNVGINTVTQKQNLKIVFKNSIFASLSANIADELERKISVTNVTQATGGVEKESVVVMGENASAYFAAQQRAVTLQDYQVLALSLPSSFGSIFRTFARKDPSNKLGVELMIVSQDSNSQLVATNGVLKNNIEKYIGKYKSFSDSIKITDGNIINIGIDFTIVPELNTNAQEALLETFLQLQKMFDISKSNFGDILILSEITSRVQALSKVRSVSSFKIINITGTVDGRTYSNVRFDTISNSRNGIVYFPQDSIWELKFKNSDIVGRTV